MSASEIIVEVLCTVDSVDGRGGGRKDGIVVGAESPITPSRSADVMTVRKVVLPPERSACRAAIMAEASMLIALEPSLANDVGGDKAVDAFVGLLIRIRLILDDNVEELSLTEIELVTAVATDMVGPTGPVSIEVTMTDGVARGPAREVVVVVVGSSDSRMPSCAFAHAMISAGRPK